MCAQWVSEYVSNIFSVGISGVIWFVLFPGIFFFLAYVRNTKNKLNQINVWLRENVCTETSVKNMRNFIALEKLDIIGGSYNAILRIA